MPVTTPCACGLASDEPLGAAYNEEAFRHLLSIERRRDASANRSTVLVLVRARRQEPGAGELPAATAARLLRALAQAVREVDVVGWVREGRVAGAVLAQGGQGWNESVPELIGQRIDDACRSEVPNLAAGRLHSRLVRLRPQPR